MFYYTEEKELQLAVLAILDDVLAEVGFQSSFATADNTEGIVKVTVHLAPSAHSYLIQNNGMISKLSLFPLNQVSNLDSMPMHL